jgi:hypothetical protein
VGCLSLRNALASIWRIRSRVTENCWPTSSEGVIGRHAHAKPHPQDAFLARRQRGQHARHDLPQVGLDDSQFTIVDDLKSNIQVSVKCLNQIRVLGAKKYLELSESTKKYLELSESTAASNDGCRSEVSDRASAQTDAQILQLLHPPWLIELSVAAEEKALYRLHLLQIARDSFALRHRRQCGGAIGLTWRR